LYIQNISQLIPKSLDADLLNLRRIGLDALEIAIESVRPEELIKKAVKIQNKKMFINNDTYDLKKYANIFIIGGGKASADMAFSIEKLLKLNSINHYCGLINVPLGFEIKNDKLDEKITINFASHPLPNENGLNGVKKMMSIVESAMKNDLIICLISGGGSALMPLPKQGVSLEELQKINSLLLASGASIQEINTIRKHLSDFKGGNLAKKTYDSSGAILISLIISDVVGNNLDSIASGPTVPDLTTFNDARKILRKYNLLEKIPSSAKQVIKEGINNTHLENPKEGDPCFNNVHNYLIGSVDSAAQEVMKFLKERNFEVQHFTDELMGEATEFGKKLCGILTNKLEFYQKNKKSFNVALIGTGELTVTIKGNGIGGRNQEMLLSFLNCFKNEEISTKFLIIGANLDGIEGNSRAMGGFVDNNILKQLLMTELDLGRFLENNDSNSFFRKHNNEIITGPTGCNVNDLVIVLLEKN